MSDSVAPSSPIAAAASVAGQTISAFRTEPVLLLIVILNIAMIGAAGGVGWAVATKVGDYFTAEENYRHLERLALIDQFTKCMQQPKSQ